MVKNIYAYYKIIVSVICYYLGIVNLFNKIRSVIGLSRVRILAFHNISDSYPEYLDLAQPSTLFESQIKYLKKNYEIISLHDAVEIIQNKQKITGDKFVITFDDNYKEYYTTVLPIKQKYDFPMTIFVTVESLEEEMPLFIDSLILAMEKTKQYNVDLSAYNLGKFSIVSKHEKLFALRIINEFSKTLLKKERRELLQIILNQFGVDGKSLKNSILSWDDLRTMHQKGINIGSHTLSHPKLSNISSTEAKEEISESKKRLEEKLEGKVDFIAYPYGDPESYNNEVKEYARNAGYLGACSLSRLKKNDIFSLGRTNMDSGVSSIDRKTFFKPLFALQISGLSDFLFLKWRNRYNRLKFSDQADSSLEKYNNKINCIYVIDRLTAIAGTEKHLYQVTGKLNKNIFSCSIIAFIATQDMIELFGKQGVKVISLDLNKIYGIKAMRCFLTLYRYFRINKPDIVQAFHFDSDTFGVLAAKLAGVPEIISSRRDMGDLKKPRQLMLNRIINPLINNIISVCNRVRDDLPISEKIPVSKIKTIYNGVDISLYEYGKDAREKAREKLGFKKDTFIVGIACILRPEKDVQLFIKAISVLKEQIKNLLAVVVGDGAEKDNILSLTNHLGLKNEIIFTGYVKDVREYIQSMDVVCLTPKENEGLSNVIIEEMAMGKPVIATDVGGNAELINDGVTGFIIPPGDNDLLVKHILALYKNVDLREEMGFAARKRVEEHFTLDIMIKNMENYYLNLLNKNEKDKRFDIC